jgi:hypothetical protein
VGDAESRLQEAHDIQMEAAMEGVPPLHYLLLPHAPRSEPDRSEYEGRFPDPEPCPECAQGKCGNCDGTAWDTVRDALGTCPCKAAGHG